MGDGDWWLYTFSTPDYSDDTARLVVASTSEEDGTAYMLAISSLTEARRHAVLNHNPFLGRITHSDLVLSKTEPPSKCSVSQWNRGTHGHSPYSQWSGVLSFPM